ncbi:hypothetical protein HQ531_06025 [bacterium]|nr:hypothetical protein [bacterium]
MKDTRKTNNEILLVTTEISKHAIALEKQLNKAGATYTRFNTDAVKKTCWPQLFLSQKEELTTTLLDDNSNPINLNSFSVIWWDEVYPSSDLFGDTQYPKWAFMETKKAMEWILSSLNAHYINYPQNILNSSNKIMQLQRAQKIGFYVPDTVVSSIPERIDKFTNEAAIYKPISRPTPDSIDDDRIVLTSRIKKGDIDYNSITSKLSLIQRYIEKKYEVRAYVVGDEVISVEIHSQESDRAKIDWRNYDIANTPHYTHILPPEIMNYCIELTKSFGLEYSAIDLIVKPNNDYVFLELNPQGLWLWIEKLTTINVTNALAQLLISHTVDH